MKRHGMTSSTVLIFIILAIAAALGVYQGMAQVHDVAVTNITKSKSIIGKGFSMQINVTAANLGELPETFNVTLNGTRQVVGTVSLHLYGSALQGWGFTPATITSPGPTLALHKGDLVNLTLTSQDGAPHQFFVDYDGDHSPSTGEPTSPIFTATINYQFIADILGTFTATTPPTQTTQIGKQLTSLNAGASTLLVFIWNTTSYAKGNYTVTATADTVLSETNTNNNALLDGYVYISMVGDVDANGMVEIKDLAQMAKIYGVNYPDPRYNANYDIDSNGKIEIKDLALAAKNYGKIDP